MRFPSVTSFRPTRPPTGADTRVNSTSSLAASTAAWASPTDASACRTFDSRMSDSSCEIAWLESRSAARAKFFRASASRDFASSTSASARRSAASYGRGSIKKRRSPLWTIVPSWKWIDCRYPLTRGRTSTESTASRRAVYSSHSVISRATGWTTFTFGGGGAGAGRAPHEERTSAAARTARATSRSVTADCGEAASDSFQLAAVEDDLLGMHRLDGIQRDTELACILHVHHQTIRRHVPDRAELIVAIGNEGLVPDFDRLSHDPPSQ